MEFGVISKFSFTLFLYVELYRAEKNPYLENPPTALQNFNYYFPPPQPQQNFLWSLPNPYLRYPLYNLPELRYSNSVGQNPNFLPQPPISFNSPSRSLTPLHMERSGRQNESDFVRADALDLESSITTIPIPIHFLKRESGERIQIDTSNKPFHFHIPFISPGTPSRTPSAKEAFAIELSKSINGAGTPKPKREDELSPAQTFPKNNDEELPTDSTKTGLSKRGKESQAKEPIRNQQNGGLSSNDLNANFPAIDELDLKLEKEIKESKVNFYYPGSEKVYLETTPEISQTLVEDTDDFQMALLTLKGEADKENRARRTKRTTVRTAKGNKKGRKKRDVKEWVDKIKKIFSKSKGKNTEADREWSKEKFESFLAELEGKDSEIDKLLPLELRTSHFLLGKEMIKNPRLRLAARKYENPHSSSLTTRRRKRSAPVEKMGGFSPPEPERKIEEALLKILLAACRGEPSLFLATVERRLRLFLDKINISYAVELDISEENLEELPNYEFLVNSELEEEMSSPSDDSPSLSFLSHNEIGEGGAIKRTKRLLPLQLPGRGTEATLDGIFSLARLLLCNSDEERVAAGSKFLDELMSEPRHDVLDENTAELQEVIKDSIACPRDNQRKSKLGRKLLEVNRVPVEIQHRF